MPLAHNLLDASASAGGGMMSYSFRFRSYLVPIFLGIAVILISVSARSQTPDTSATRPSPSSGTTSWGLHPASFPPWFEFEKSAVINRWIDQRNTDAMTFHAWRLWGALSSLTAENFRGAEAPVFMTWWPQEDTFSAPTTSNARIAAAEPAIRFRRPHVPTNRFAPAAAHPMAAATATPLPGSQNPVTVTVQYDNDVYVDVQANQYFSPTVLNNINNTWGNTPLANQSIQNFPNTSVAIKPTYLFAYANQPTQLQYWTGAVNSTTPETPAYGTWTDWLWVVPPGVDPATFKRQQNDGHEVVSVNNFYHFPLTAADFNVSNDPLNGSVLFPNNPMSQSGFQPGDFAILVAMHVATREVPNWTWQTFWWTSDTPAIPNAIQAKIKAPFDHYQTAVAYSYTQDGLNSPSSLPTLCFNPFLETGFDNSTFVYPGQLGIESNCISCHRAATWPAIPPSSAPAGSINPGYVAYGVIDPGDSYLFGGQTKTDFLWGVQNNVPTPVPTP
jgi:hypothetical protein